MNNFFYDASDYSLFKKALKTTENEPVVVNILSTDSSLQTKKEKTAESNAVRKNMSKKYEPSPFGKFFGPRKQQAVSVDMRDFSSWKNKNYRKAEESIDYKFGNEAKFSMSDFMSDKSKDKFTDIDQTKSDLQKPINQLSTSDPLYKRFSLDSYMHKLEEQTLVKDKFEENDDILEPLGDATQSVVPDSSQDENFGFGSNVNIEKVAFDENISGEQFKFEQEELDKFRSRLDKIEREAANIKEKTNEKVIDSNVLTEISGGFDLDNLTDDEENESDGIQVDDIEKINDKLTASDEEEQEIPKTKGKTFFEVNKNEPSKKSSKKHGLISSFDTEEADETQTEETVGDETQITDETNSADETKKSDTDEFNEEHVIDEGSKVAQDDSEKASDETDESSVSGKTSHVSTDKVVQRGDVVTKDDLKSMTDELVTKFTQLYQKDTGSEAGYMETDGTPIPSEDYVDDPNMFVYPDANFVSQGTYGGNNDDMLRAQLQELINSNKKLDLESERRLRDAELEKERVAAEYESRIREMEQSFKQSYEDFKKQAYLDKLDRDIKLKEAETKFKKKTAVIKEQEKESYAKEKTGAMLRKELKSHLNISNLEMDKKLLEIASGLSSVERDRLEQETQEMARQLEEERLKAQLAAEREAAEEAEEIEDVEEEVDEKEESEKKKSTTKSSSRKTTRRKPTTRRTAAKKGSRRKIDSDIIGGIDFE